MPYNKETASISGQKSSRKGTPNKVTSEHRQLIDKLISCPDDLEKDLRELSPKDRMDSIIKLLEYTTPKLARKESIHSGDVSVSSLLFEDAEKNTD